jgi:hypothetical protein
MNFNHIDFCDEPELFETSRKINIEMNTISSNKNIKIFDINNHNIVDECEKILNFNYDGHINDVLKNDHLYMNICEGTVCDIVSHDQNETPEVVDKHKRKLVDIQPRDDYQSYGYLSDTSINTVNDINQFNGHMNGYASYQYPQTRTFVDNPTYIPIYNPSYFVAPQPPPLYSYIYGLNYIEAKNYYEIERFIKYAKYIITLHQDENERIYRRVKVIDNTINHGVSKLEICKLRVDILSNLDHLYKYVEYVMATKLGVEYVNGLLNNGGTGEVVSETGTNETGENEGDIKQKILNLYKYEMKRLTYKYNLLSEKIIEFDKKKNKMLNHAKKYIARKEAKKKAYNSENGSDINRKNKRKYHLVESLQPIYHNEK